MIGTCVERFGRVDVPVANAGAITLSTIDDTAPEDWDHVMGGDAPVLQTRHRGDAADGRGSIVRRSSISGVDGQKEQAAYSPAKFVARGPGCRSGRALPLRRGYAGRSLFITSDHIIAFEEEHGALKEGEVVLLQTA